LPPGVLRCNETNPCTGMVFEDVHITGWWDSLLGRLLGVNNFITENMEGSVVRSHPNPGFDKSDSKNSDVKTDFALDIFKMILKALFAGSNGEGI